MLQVSILVMLDLPWEEISDVDSMQMITGFNPCCIGFAVGGSRNQILFLWKVIFHLYLSFMKTKIPQNPFAKIPKLN